MSLPSKEERCEGRLWDSGGFFGHQCEKRHQPGSRFCKTHDPEIQKQKLKARGAKWQAEWDAKEKATREAEVARKLAEHKAACFDELLAACKAVLDHVQDDQERQPPSMCRLCYSNRKLLFDAIAKAEKLP